MHFVCVCVCVAVLEVEAFERLLGPCLEIMQRNVKDYEIQLTKLGLTNRLELRHSADLANRGD